MEILDKYKQQVIAEIEKNKAELIALSVQIHAHPELSFQEFKAAECLTGYLSKNGFAVENNIADLPTAFRATYKGTEEEPIIGLLAEYDALPKVGHGCGHNIMGVAGPGAAVAVKNIIADLPGQIQVIGTPAEENGGGKIIMAKKGAFDHLSAAMIVHPGTRTEVNYKNIACQSMKVEFFGKASHASGAPEKGINALDAVILSYNMINALRQHIRQDSRIHGIITHGGEASNIVPEYASASFTVRSPDDKYLDALIEKVLNCFRAAAQATGARFEYQLSPSRYASMRTNKTLAFAFAENYRKLGVEVQERRPDAGMGSSDMGNVSHIIPAIHPSIAIAPESIQEHSTDFAAAAVSEAGHLGLLNTAKALAMTTIDLLFDPYLLINARNEFQEGGIKE
ncbi:MAG: M20 family metallopeptidase [bacterium]|nr:M20 family metallopeptidase [bacterium]